MNNNVAIIDIGSNSARLLIISNAGETLQKVTIITKLAEGAATTGLLTKPAIARASTAVETLYQCALLETDNVYIFATEAVRRAENRQSLTDSIYCATGLLVDIISGEIEAEIGYIGATLGRNGGSEFENSASIIGAVSGNDAVKNLDIAKEHDFTVIDVGGASTECVFGSGGVIKYAKSIAIGAVKLTELSGGNYADAVLIAERYLSELDYTSLRKGEMIAIGGTATTISAINLQLEEYDSARIHNSHLTAKELADISNRLWRMTVEEKYSLRGLQRGRADVIAAGSLILNIISKKLRKKVLMISESDNLEGYYCKIKKK